VNFKGGTSQAKKLLTKFIKSKLDKYPVLRNDPTQNYESNLSPYIHFGQISPVYIALKVKQTNSPGKDAFLEQLIVRRELAHNLVYYNKNYYKYQILPAWAKTTLNFHKKDKRQYIYTLEQFELAQTHDPAWNAAQTQMVITGKMHNYMRMYWGKKIIEWSRTPEEAFDIALYLNNKYELDGRDPNGFTGILWCFGMHDRPWPERHVFGKVRYMNFAGLKRKFDVQKFIDSVERIKAEKN
jgi:deoxyribodipyrimidine photo-lyase